MSDLQYFIKPFGVALIGASANPEKLGYGILDPSFSGFALAPINATPEGLKKYCRSLIFTNSLLLFWNMV